MIKDCERENRNEEDYAYSMTGPAQTRPIDFAKSLRNRKFKEAFVEFLAEHWKSETAASILNEKKVFLTVQERCLSFRSVDNAAISSKEKSYTCFHEEADTRIIYHISKVKPKSKIMIQATDTDILVILLGNMHNLNDKTIFIASTFNKNDEQQCLNCTELAEVLGQDLCKALPGFHAFRGCDYTAAFYRKGKAHPFNLYIWLYRPDFPDDITRNSTLSRPGKYC